MDTPANTLVEKHAASAKKNALAFSICVEFILRPEIEGGLTVDPRDRGNWSGGEIGQGELRGSIFGLSAARFKNLDPRTLSLNDARELAEQIYWAEYWYPACCDKVPLPVAALMLDAAVNQGPATAIQCVQSAARVAIDGKFGSKTLYAIEREFSANPRGFLLDVAAARGWHYCNAREQQEKDFGYGWMRRLLACHLFSISLINS